MTIVVYCPSCDEQTKAQVDPIEDGDVFDFACEKCKKEIRIHVDVYVKERKIA